MALPVEQNNNRSNDDDISSQIPHKRFKSMHVSTPTNATMKRKSLLYSEQDTQQFNFIKGHAPLINGAHVTRTNIWRCGSGPGSVFLDMTDRDEDKLQLLQWIADQYPSRIGVLTHTADKLRFAEIHFDKDDPALSTILERGLVFADQSIVLPCKAYDKGDKTVHLRLSNLPFMHEKMLSDSLTRSLAPYGEVLDVGMLVESTSGTYMCTGYAILDLTPAVCKVLTHVLPWSNSDRAGFYAVWNGMPDYCRCCHSMEHVMEDCPQAGGPPTGEMVMDESGFEEYADFARKKKREFINLEVVSVEGSSTTFKIKRITQLYKLMLAYCKQHRKSPQNMRFIYKGLVLLYDKTPDDMNMEEGDKIECIENQIKGV